MGIIYILIAVSMNAVKGYFSKKVSSEIECSADNTVLSLLRNSVCAIIGALVIFILCGKQGYEISPYGLLICCLSGIFAALSYIVWITALKRNAYVLVSGSNASSFIIPSVLCMIFFNEKPSLYKLISVLLISIGIFFLLKYQKKGKKQYAVLDAKGILLLVCVFASSGFSSFTQKWFIKTQNGASLHTYTFYTYLAASLTMILICMFIKIPDSMKPKSNKFKRFLLFAVIMGAALYGSTYFQSLSSSLLDAVVIYPLNNGLSLTAGMLLSWIFFKENPNRYSIIGMLFVISAVIVSRL